MNTIYILTLIALGALGATYIGGYFALRFKDKMHLMLGLAAGLMLGVAFLDLIPEAIELSEHADELVMIMLWVVIGFVGFMIIDRFGGHYHSHTDVDCEHDMQAELKNSVHTQGKIGAGSLSFHSLLDGFVVGVAFQVSPILGATVALAVLIHGFSDGLSTVTLITRHGGDKKTALRWLTLDACAPVLGIILGSLIAIPLSLLSPILGIFSGFFIYIGASDLLPESHHGHKTLWTTAMTLMGMAIVLIVVLLGHGH